MSTTVYSGSHQTCAWEGNVFTADDVEAFRSSIRERALDLEHQETVADRLASFADTGAKQEFLSAFLNEATTDEVLDWQVGEAFAEAVLQDEHSVTLLWNTRRDERNPKASLQGADIVGLHVDEDAPPLLLFGEVKSSKDENSPPDVLYGSSGMIDQLKRLVESPRVSWRLNPSSLHNSRGDSRSRWLVVADPRTFIVRAGGPPGAITVHIVVGARPIIGLRIEADSLGRATRVRLKNDDDAGIAPRIRVQAVMRWHGCRIADVVGVTGAEPGLVIAVEYVRRWTRLSGSCAERRDSEDCSANRRNQTSCDHHDPP